MDSYSEKWHPQLEVESVVNWRLEMVGEFQPDIDLLKLAHEYHERCDSYDRLLCRNEEGRPVDGYQLGAINRHARLVLNQLKERQRQEDIEGDLIKEIQRMRR